MLRRLFTLTSALSLVLCAATVVLCVRSYWYGDAIVYNTAVKATGNETSSVTSAFGRMYIDFERCQFVPALRDEFIHVYNNGHSGAWFSFNSRRNEPLNEPTRRGMRWFRYLHPGDRGNPASDPIVPWWEVWRITIPIPLLTALSGSLPAVYLWRRMNARLRRQHGRCASCGYDLRASPDRCPECGTPVRDIADGSRFNELPADAPPARAGPS